MNFIALQIEDKDLYLPPDFNIRFSFTFPYPFRDSVPVMCSYWFTIPATDWNSMIFKHSNKINVTAKITSYPVSIRVSGLSFKGKLYVKNASNKEYKTFVVFNDLSETLTGKQLSEVVNDTHSLGTEYEIIYAAKSMSQNTYDDGAKYAFPHIRNESFYGDTNENYKTLGNFMNNYNRQIQNYIQNYIDNNQVFNVNVMVPMPYLFFVIKNMFEQIGWGIGGEVFDDANFKKLICYNNYQLENISEPYFIELGFADEFDLRYQGKLPYKFPEVISDEKQCYNLDTGVYSCKSSGSYKWIYIGSISVKFNLNQNRTLKLYIKHDETYDLLFTYNVPAALQHIETFTFSGDINLTENTNYSFWYELDGNLVDSYLFDVDIKFSMVSNGLNRFNSIVNLKNHVPAISTSDFLTELSKKFFFAIFFNFNSKTVEFKHWNTIIESQDYLDLTHCLIKDTEDISMEEKNYSFSTEWKADDLIEGNFKDLAKFKGLAVVDTAEDLPTAAIINQICLVKNQNRYWVTVRNQDTQTLEWKANFDNFYNILSSAKEATEIKTVIHTLFMRQAWVIYPEIKQQGSSPEMGINDAGFKLLNYHGFQDDYPLASNTIYKYDGTNLGGVPMQLQGIDGTFDRYGKKIINYLLDREPVEMDLQLTADDFLQIAELFQSGSEKHKIHIGNKTYLPDTIDITIGMNKIEACKVKLI